MHGRLPLFALLCSAAVSFGWDLKPDPPADKTWAVQPGLAVPTDETDDIAFAEANGPFVLTGIGKSNTRKVFDLRTGFALSKIVVEQTKPTGDREILSPNGKVWAYGKSLGDEVKVFSAATGKWLPAVKTDASIMNVGFAPDGRLAVVTSGNKLRTLRLFDTATGKEQANWEIDATGYYLPGNATRVFAVSPGGKYLAASGAKAITVYATADGKTLADVELPAVERGGLQPMVGVAFSADGSELAAVVGKTAKGTTTLKVWKLADGTSAEHTLNRPATLPGHFAPALAAVLSGGWLIDGTQVWADGQVRAVPETVAVTPTRLAVTPTQLVAVVSPPLLERGKTKPTVGVLGGSGTASTVAKDGTLVGAVEMPTDERAGTPGAVAAFALPFAPPSHKLTMPKGAVGLTVSLDGRRCFLESDWGKPTNTAKRTVLSVDAQTGASQSFDLPEKRVVFGDALTSDAFLTIGAPDAGGDGERLEMFTADGKSVVVWRPHPEAKPDQFRSSVLYAAALSASRAITIGNGRVTLWQLPEAKAVWSANMPAATGGGLSPDGKVLFISHAGGVRALKVETGGTLGNLTADGAAARNWQDGYAVAVSGDGKRLAMLGGPPTSRVLRVWELADGSLITQQTLRYSGDVPTLRFFGPRFVLAGEQVFDLTDRREVWKLKPPQVGVMATSAPADGRVWFVSGTVGNADLHGSAFPDDQLARFLTDYEKTGDGGVFQKGEAVKVVIEAPADAPPGWDAQARTSARIALASAKLTEDANAATVVTVTYSIVPGESIKMKWQGAANLGREETIRKFSVESRAVVTRNGQVVHTAPPFKTDMRIKEWPQVNEIDDDSKSGQEFFTRQVWRSAGFGAGAVFASSGAGYKQSNGVTWRLPGEAKLEGGGLKMNWPAGMEPRAVEGSVVGTNMPTPAPQPVGAGASVWVIVVVGGVCGGVLVAVGVVVLVLVMRAKARKKKLDDDDDLPRRRRHDDDGDDGPRRRR